jgi:hypothetical protein
MQTLRVSERTGNDGVLHVSVPLGTPGVDYDIVLVVQPKEPLGLPTPEDLGWPPGYFELAGSIDDETFVRPPQGELPKAVEFD